MSMKLRHSAALALVGWYLRVVIILIALPATWLAYLYAVRPFAIASTSTEVERVESPGHELEVVVVESNHSALEPPAFDVYLTKPGSNRLGKSVLGTIGKNDLKFRWISARLLEISYSDACIVSFRNHWENTVLPSGGDYDVEIRLKPPQDGVPRPFCA
jgi:hypothetical protein